MAKEQAFELPAPRANPMMIGHGQAQAQFIEEFAQGRMHHAYLMTGPKGIGKATLAYRFARHVLSQGALEAKVEEAPSMSLFGDEPEPVISHQSPVASALDMDADSSLFRRIAANSHTDLLTLSPAFDVKKGVEKDIITVDDARKVPEFLSLTPAEGLWRVVIVDAVDQLNDNAANALLKILEEPPARAWLFLVCHQPGGALATIRSRCRSLALSAPNADEFAEILNQLAPSLPQHDYTALYGLSYGSPGHAMTLAQEHGLKWYENWLQAMQPDAALDVRQRFADAAGGSKSPATWAAVVHAWHVAMHRLTLFPHYDISTPITRREAEMLERIAQSMPMRARNAWLADGARLLHQTETFNLDKRQTLRLLADAGQLCSLAA